MPPGGVRQVGGDWSRRPPIQGRKLREPCRPGLRIGRVAATAAVAAVLIVAQGCAPRPRRVPYIPPDLPNWSDQYQAPKGLRLHVFQSTGSLSPPMGVLGGSWLRHKTLEVPAFLVEHPQAGLLVVGTGLAPEIGPSPEKHLGWFLSAVASATVEDKQDLVSQLKTAGFAPEEVDRVILRDCRFPETGQIQRFPEADVVVAAAERAWALRGGPTSAVLRDDVMAIRRWATIDFEDAAPLATFSGAHDVLGDGSVWLLDTAGYTPGTMAVLVRLTSGPVVLAGGVAPLEGTMRMPVVPALATDPERWWDSAWRLKRFRELAENVVVIPGFEPSGPAIGRRSDVSIHGSEGGEEAERKPTREPRQTARPTFPFQDPPTSPPPLGR